MTPKPVNKYTNALKGYRKRGAVVEDVFVRMLRILKEHQDRHEREMFQPDNYVPRTSTHASDVNEGGIWNKGLAKEARELASAVTHIGQMFFKVQKEAKEAADMLTFDERVEAVISWASGLGRNNTKKLLDALHRWEYELEAEHKKRHGNSDRRHDSKDSGIDLGFDPVSD